MKLTTVFSLAVVAGSLAVACDNPPITNPLADRAAIASGYRAMRVGASEQKVGKLDFTASGGGVTRDLLDVGALLEVELNQDGTMSGHLHLPESVLDGSSDEILTDYDLAGTWTVNGTSVRLNTNADVFLRDMDFAVRGQSLEAEKTFDGLATHVVLQRAK